MAWRPTTYGTALSDRNRPTTGETDTPTVPRVNLRWNPDRFWGYFLQCYLCPQATVGSPELWNINATIERLTDSPTWRGPWKRGQRCILPAVGFCEWHLNDDGSKQPFYITCADQPVFGIAGLWDSSKRGDGAVVESCTIITMPRNALMAEIHNAKQRMPMILTYGNIEASPRS